MVFIAYELVTRSDPALKAFDVRAYLFANALCKAAKLFVRRKFGSFKERDLSER